MNTDVTPVPADSESDAEARRRERRKRKSTSEFWRACRFLYPYRAMVATSIVCAFFIGIAFTGGLSSMVPMMQVFLKGDTIESWANREIAERRLGVDFPADDSKLRIMRLRDGGIAANNGFQVGDVLGDRAAIAALSAPGAVTIASPIPGAAPIELPPLPRHLAIGREVSMRMPTHPVKAIAAVLAAIACLAIVSNVVKYFQEYLSDKAAILAVQDIRRRLYDRVLHVPMSHFNLRGASDVTSRLTQDAQELVSGFKTVLGQSIQEPIKVALAFGLAMYVSWKLTMFIVVFGPLMFLIIKKLGKKMRRASRKAMINSASMLGQIEGSLIGIRVVKGASAERFERRRYGRIMQQLVNEQLRMARIDAFSGPTIETLSFFVVASIVLFATYMVLIRRSLDVPSFILVMACLGGIGDSLRRLSKVNNVLQKSSSAAARIFEVLDLPIERSRDTVERRQGDTGRGDPVTRGQGDKVMNRAAEGASAPGHLVTGSPGHRVNASLGHPVKLPPIQRDIRFENVTFAYPGSSTPALTGVSLRVPRGQSVAIVGRNGSGKTTLLALLPRFYDPQQGRVLIDGVDVRNVTLRSLRKQISIVTQDSVIFPGTIADNIAYGEPLTSREEIVAAAKRAFAHEFILEKPQGYDTMLGELGGQLSGGQKQRLCIARAVLRKSPILVLDEATSQVDAESEHLIQQAIEGLMHERTTFVIAHRFSTITSADTIVVMDRGGIVGQGKHDELLGTCETYQQLYERQLFAAPAA